MSLEKKQARAVQAATGRPYQSCLNWVRANHAALRRRTGDLHAKHGLTEAGRRAALELFVSGHAGGERSSSPAAAPPFPSNEPAVDGQEPALSSPQSDPKGVDRG